MLIDLLIHVGIACGIFAGLFVLAWLAGDAFWKGWFE